MNKDNIKAEIRVNEQKISVLRIDGHEYISLTDPLSADQESFLSVLFSAPLCSPLCQNNFLL